MKKVLGTVGSILFLLVAIVIGKVIGHAVGNATGNAAIQGTPTANTQSYSMPAEQMPVQRVDRFSVKYASPFLINEKESRDMTAALEAKAPSLLQSIDIFTSRPSCGVGEARLVVGTYTQVAQLSIDSAANGSINQISTLSGITSPENTITLATVSGYPARRVSYRSKRWGGVLGAEFIVIVDLQTNTLWQLQLIFSARNTSDYASLNSAQSCARKILESVAIGAAP